MRCGQAIRAVRHSQRSVLVGKRVDQTAGVLVSLREGLLVTRGP